jgi:hypothetical protein
MSWYISIESDREVTNETIRRILKKLPQRLKGPFNCSENDWGWSCATDIQKQEKEHDNNILQITGAGFTRDIGYGMAVTLAKLLRKEGHTVEVGEMY